MTRGRFAPDRLLLSPFMPTRMTTNREPPTETARTGHAPSPDGGGRRRILGWGLTLVGVGMCVVLAWSAPKSLVEAFESVRLVPALLAVALMLATRIVDAWLLVHLFAEKSGDIGFRHAIRIVTLQNLSAFVAPKSGLVAAAALLKIEHGVGLARFTGAQIASLAIKVVMTASIGLAAALVVRLGDSSSSSTGTMDATILGFASLPPLVGLGYLLASRFRIPSGDGGWIRRTLSDTWLGITSLSRDGRRLTWILALSAITAVTKIISFLLIVYGVLGVLESPLGVIVVSTASELGTALSFTPAGLGIREAIAGITAGFADVTPPLMIGIALVDRALMLLTTGILAPSVFIRRTQ